MRPMPFCMESHWRSLGADDNGQHLSNSEVSTRQNAMALIRVEVTSTASAFPRVIAGVMLLLNCVRLCCQWCIAYLEGGDGVEFALLRCSVCSIDMARTACIT